tara:strand:+ start:1452 stop:1700 length:249 start_codon:yes stop_codon:yes gene_type:complete
MDSEVYANPSEGELLKDWWDDEGNQLLRGYGLKAAIITGSGEAYVTIRRDDNSFSYDQMDDIVIEVADSMEDYGLTDVGYTL